MLSPHMSGRTRPVRLADVPLKVRQRAASPLIERARMDGDLPLAADLTSAVERPSGRTYWVSQAAIEKVLG